MTKVDCELKQITSELVGSAWSEAWDTVKSRSDIWNKVWTEVRHPVQGRVWATLVLQIRMSCSET
jgi:hypothetical protein